MLFMDNVSSHVGSDALGLSNVTVKFLPPSTTSHLQPRDGGIIQVEISPETNGVHIINPC